MDWRLGLDLGTNSIGWAVYSIDKNKKVEELVDLGVRIFSDGREPKTKEPLALARRTARGQRKLIHRRKLRRRATFRALREENLVPKEKEAALALKVMNPYELRIEALDRKLEPYELGRVLFNLSVRRGFKSNRKDGNNEYEKEASLNSEKLSQKDMQTNLMKAVKESGCRTLGEFLWKNQDKNGGIRFVPGRMTYYPVRQMYIDEFNTIKEKQEQYFPNVDWDKIYHCIFDQRNLKPQPRGKCLYMNDKDRTYKALPCAQKLRILQEIRNLNYIDENGARQPISEEQDKILYEFLDSKEKVTFEQMKKKLGLAPQCSFNLETELRPYLLGNSTNVFMKNEKRFGSLWETFSLEEQDNICEVLITSEEDSEVMEMLSKYDLSAEQKEAITKAILKPGTTMLCKEVSEAFVHKMESNCAATYTSAVNMLGYKYADQSVEKCNLLPYYGKVLTGSTVGGDLSKGEDEPEKRYGKISNPTVHIALNQTRTIVNCLIKEYGKPAQIVVEVSRELKASREAKARMIKTQRDNAKRNEAINIALRDGFKIDYPNRNDRMKYRLWEELGVESSARRCLYCGKTISASELFTKEIEIEHILPYSRTLLDAETNLTVAHASCNAFKKEKSPFEAFGSNPNGYNWSEILIRANSLKNQSKRAKFSITAMDDFEKDSNFVARQLTDNAYLSRTAYKYLHCVCDDVWTVNGGMTKLLRDKWNIDSILKRKITDVEIAHFNLSEDKIGEYKKNRCDHRHHALDASVIALIDRGLVKEISTLNARSMKNRIEVPEFPVLRTELEEKVKNIVVSFKPDHGREGQLSKETLLGKIKKEECIDIAKLKEEDISNIKVERIKKEISEKYVEVNDIKKVIKEFSDIYPQIKIFKEYYVSRVAVTSLKENNISDIVDVKVRQKLQEYVASHKGQKFEQILEDFTHEVWTGSKKNGNGKKYRINKVRCINRVQTPIVIEGDVPRYLCPDDYFAAIIWKVPAKKDGGKDTYQAQYLRRDQIGSDNKPSKEFLKEGMPHPAAKVICTLHKNDYLELSADGKMIKCRIAGYAATQNKLDIRPIYASNTLTDWIITTNDFMLEKYWKPVDGQNFISVNVVFGELMARPITVNPIGRTFRK